MSDSPGRDLIDTTFNIKEYVEATNDAAKRTRTVTIVLVVASVLISIGWYNSLVWSWPIDRLKRAYDVDDPAVYRALNADELPQLRSGKALLEPRDIVDPILLARKLHERSTPLSAYLNDRMTLTARELLDEFVRGCQPARQSTEAPAAPRNCKPARELVEALANDLNRALTEHPLYDPRRFEGVPLSDGTKNLMGKIYGVPVFAPEDFIKQTKEKLKVFPPKHSQLVRLNRLLLEDAYPQEVAKSFDNFATPVDEYRMQLQWQGLRSYIENVRMVKTPFFGVAVDVNDLAPVGGIGLIIILLMLRFSISREIKNLKLSFEESLRHGKLRAFYYALAMGQVFTVPEMENEARNKFLAAAPKFIYILPAFLFTLGVVYDCFTVFSGPQRQFDYKEVPFTLSVALLWLLPIWWLSWRCWERHRHIDKVWRDYWNRMSRHKSSVIYLTSDLVEKFGTDAEANRALRRYRRLADGETLPTHGPNSEADTTQQPSE